MAESRIQRAIGSIYSWSAERIYEPLIVHGSFRVIAGDLDELVGQQSRRAVSAANGRPILDIPVGTGYFTATTAHLATGLVVGADYAWGMVRAAASNEGERIAVVQADIHRLPFTDGTFGAALCTNGLQVIPGLNASLKELARVLVDRGVLLITVIVAPIGGLLPDHLNRRLPTLFRTGRSIADELIATGFAVTAFRRSRFAYLIEAVKLKK